MSLFDRHPDSDYLLRWADTEVTSSTSDLVDLAKLARDAIQEGTKLRAALGLACMWLDPMAEAAGKKDSDLAAKVQADVALIRKTMEQTK